MTSDARASGTPPGFFAKHPSKYTPGSSRPGISHFSDQGRHAWNAGTFMWERIARLQVGDEKTPARTAGVRSGGIEANHFNANSPRSVFLKRASLFLVFISRRIAE